MRRLVLLAVATSVVSGTFLEPIGQVTASANSSPVSAAHAYGGTSSTQTKTDDANFSVTWQHE